MKINETHRVGAYYAYQHAADNRASSASGKRRKDEVAFSAEAMELLKSRKMDESDRQQRIAQLKREVSAGTYRVPDHLLVEKLAPFFYPISGK